jgi:hypothetical protein
MVLGAPDVARAQADRPQADHEQVGGLTAPSATRGEQRTRVVQPGETVGPTAGRAAPELDTARAAGPLLSVRVGRAGARRWALAGLAGDRIDPAEEVVLEPTDETAGEVVFDRVGVVVHACIEVVQGDVLEREILAARHHRPEAGRSLSAIAAA